jgi:hypothetical protein
LFTQPTPEEAIKLILARLKAAVCHPDDDALASLESYVEGTLKGDSFVLSSHATLVLLTYLERAKSDPVHKTNMRLFFIGALVVTIKVCPTHILENHWCSESVSRRLQGLGTVTGHLVVGLST